ncbi:hypothetical protein [Streptomyces sp. G45]|uniref:hypothetical protein n=1 Tax=Streptomyces sp. G45 TaxID=3406627 RepID=UPI003C186D43
MTADLPALEDRAQRAYADHLAHLSACPACGRTTHGCRTGALLRRAVRDAKNTALRVRRARPAHTEGGGGDA